MVDFGGARQIPARISPPGMSRRAEKKKSESELLAEETLKMEAKLRVLKAEVTRQRLEADVCVLFMLQLSAAVRCILFVTQTRADHGPTVAPVGEQVLRILALLLGMTRMWTSASSSSRNGLRARWQALLKLRNPPCAAQLAPGDHYDQKVVDFEFVFEYLVHAQSLLQKRRHGAWTM